MLKGTLLGTPNRGPQEYGRNVIGTYLPGSLYSTIFLLYSWGSLFGVPIRTLLEAVGVGCFCVIEYIFSKVVEVMYWSC